MGEEESVGEEEVGTGVRLAMLGTNASCKPSYRIPRVVESLCKRMPR